jgi:hypothetical protein
MDVRASILHLPPWFSLCPTQPYARDWLAPGPQSVPHHAVRRQRNGRLVPGMRILAYDRSLIFDDLDDEQ